MAPTAKLMRFRVLAGRHTDENSKQYSAGDIVTTRINLVQRFGRKFEPVYGEPDADTVNDGLGELSLKKLQEIAVLEEIDLNGATRKEDVLTVIRQARDAVEA